MGDCPKEPQAVILATSTAGVDITLSNVALSGVRADTKNAVWIDETTPDAPVTVKGGTAVTETYLTK